MCGSLILGSSYLVENNVQQGASLIYSVLNTQSWSRYMVSIHWSATTSLPSNPFWSLVITWNTTLYRLKNTFSNHHPVAMKRINLFKSFVKMNIFWWSQCWNVSFIWLWEINFSVLYSNRIIGLQHRLTQINWSLSSLDHSTSVPWSRDTRVSGETLETVWSWDTDPSHY